MRPHRAVEQMARAQHCGPQAGGIRRGQPAAPWRGLPGPVGFQITDSSPLQPEKATGASPIPPSPTTPSTTASCRPTVLCAEVGTTVAEASPPAWKDKELLQFFAHVVTSLLLAGAHQCAARQSGRAQMRLRNYLHWREIPGGCPLGQAKPPCGSARTSPSRPARSRLPERCVPGDSVGGGVLRSSSPCSRA
jgi:hypothetical protein